MPRGFEEKVLSKLDAIDQRFEAVDQRFDAMEQTLQNFREEVKQEFWAVRTEM